MKAVKFLSPLIVPMICIVLTLSAYTEEEVDEKKLQPSEKKERIYLVVEQSYGQAEGVSLPVEDLAKNMLEYTKLEVKTEDIGEYEYTIRIEVKGQALSEEYSPYLGLGSTSTIYYTGARVSGNIILELSNIPFFKTSFYGIEHPPSTIDMHLEPKSPSGAPFLKAMESSSFLYQFAGMIAEIYGPLPVVAALMDADINVRNQCARALKTMGATATPHLIFALKVADTTYQSIISNILIDIGEAALDQLLATMEDKSFNVRKNLVFILGKIGDPRAIEPMIALLENPDSQLQKIVAENVKKFNTESVDPLITALKKRDPNVRKIASEILGDIGDPRAIGPLIIALKDTNPDVRICAAQALGKLQDHRAVEPLIVSLKDKNANVRKNSVEILGALGDSRAVEPLISALSDVDHSIKLCAVEALGKIGDPRAIDPLIAKLQDPDTKTQNTAVEALKKFGNEPLDPLIIVLNGKNSYGKKQVLEILGEIGDPRAVKPIINSLKDSDSDTRNAAINALTKIGDPSVEPLIETLEDEDPKVRFLAAWALGEIGDFQAVEPLISSLKDRKIFVRKISAQSLEKITSQTFGINHDEWLNWLNEQKLKN